MGILTTWAPVPPCQALAVSECLFPTDILDLQTSESQQASTYLASSLGALCREGAQEPPTGHLATCSCNQMQATGFFAGPHFLAA